MSDNDSEVAGSGRGGRFAGGRRGLDPVTSSPGMKEMSIILISPPARINGTFLSTFVSLAVPSLAVPSKC